MTNELDTLKSQLEREKQKVAELESLIEDSTRDLYVANEGLKKTKDYYETILESMNGAVFVVSKKGEIRRINRSASQFLALDPEKAVDQSIQTFLRDPLDFSNIHDLLTSGTTIPESDSEHIWMTTKQDAKPALTAFSLVTHRTSDESDILMVVKDMSNRRLLEQQLQQAQRLESIGTLAAGVAHEINTPIQFIKDNAEFTANAFSDLLPVIQTLKQVKTAGSSDSTETLTTLSQQLKEIDLDFLSSELPQAFKESKEGLSRVTSIVAAMKEFSHMEKGKEKQLADINQALENTLTVCRNEWKNVAKIESNFDQDLPEINCFEGDLKQVFLNLIVNACHAISDIKATHPDHQGVIRITTKLDRDVVVIELSDNGIGISDEDAEKVFDPFFTTKEVGKGTGQGLSLAYNVVQKKHRGTILFSSEQGKGTTFCIRLPVQN